MDDKKILFHGYAGGCAIYSKNAPDDDNYFLYARALEDNSPEKLIEKNICAFSKIIGETLFYYVGNAHRHTLITAHIDGTERHEWPNRVSQILSLIGGWLYYTRTAGYDTVLCRARLDGSESRIVASDVEKIVEIKNGYLYYIDSYDTLLKVRLDGTNSTVLCKDVEEVLSVTDERIVFVSIDKVTTTTFGESDVRKDVISSIYSVDFLGDGIRKLVYNITEAKERDANNNKSQ